MEAAATKVAEALARRAQEAPDREPPHGRLAGTAPVPGLGKWPV